MPFEYGVDWACRRWFGAGRDAKRLLVLEEKPYRYQAALSDVSGWTSNTTVLTSRSRSARCATGW